MAELTFIDAFCARMIVDASGGTTLAARFPRPTRAGHQSVIPRRAVPNPLVAASGQGVPPPRVLDARGMSLWRGIGCSGRSPYTW